MDFWIVQSLNGLSFGMLLFLLASGLSLVFGLMGIVNLTHGSFYLLGAYLGFTLIGRTGSFLVALLVAPPTIAVLGLLIHRFLLRRFPKGELAQVLLTFGLLFIFADLTLWYWGGYSQVLPKPAFLATSLIQHLDPSITVLLIEHDMDVAFQVAQHITVLHQGRLLADGSPEAIRKDPTVAEIYLGTE